MAEQKVVFKLTLFVCFNNDSIYLTYINIFLFKEAGSQYDANLELHYIMRKHHIKSYCEHAQGTPLQPDVHFAHIDQTYIHSLLYDQIIQPIIKCTTGKFISRFIVSVWIYMLSAWYIIIYIYTNIIYTNT